jgi:hypothetical protein
MVADAEHVVQVRADAALAVAIEPLVPVDEPEAVQDFGVAGVVPVPRLLVRKPLEQDVVLVRLWDLVVVVAVLQPASRVISSIDVSLQPFSAMTRMVASMICFLRVSATLARATTAPLAATPLPGPLRLTAGSISDGESPGRSRQTARYRPNSVGYAAHPRG